MAAKALVVGIVVFVATRLGDVPGAAVFALASCSAASYRESV